MDSNIKIVMGDGSTLDAVGISYIHLDSTNKDYIFYSLNELANGNMDKIYISEVSQNGTTPGTINEEEWKNLKTIMLNISHNETVSGITYKPLMGLTFNVGEAKKLAIKGDKKQAFIDAQNKAIAPTTNIDEPAFVSDQAANGSPFFAADINVTADSSTSVQDVQPSAFNMQPPVEDKNRIEDLGEEIASVPDESDIQQNNSLNVIAENNSISMVSVSNDNSVEENNAELLTMQIDQNNIQQTELIKDSTINSSDNLNIDLINASIEKIQNEINIIKSMLNLDSNKQVVLNTTQVQSIATGQSAVAIESINIADQPEIKVDNLETELELNNDSINNQIISTEVSTNIDEPVEIIEDVSIVSDIHQEEPAFDVNDIASPVATLDLNNVQDLSTPNSAQAINNEDIQVVVPDAPVDISTVPQIPISPNEQNSIPSVDIIQPNNNEVDSLSSDEAVEPLTTINNDIDIQPLLNGNVVQNIPEISGVQQVPTLDLSAINTDVTLPNDITSNPNPGIAQDGLLGPATLNTDPNQQ